MLLINCITTEKKILFINLNKTLAIFTRKTIANVNFGQKEFKKKKKGKSLNVVNF